MVNEGYRVDLSSQLDTYSNTNELIVFNRLLKVDNRGQQQISESTEMVNGGYRVDLSSELNTVILTN